MQLETLATLLREWRHRNLVVRFQDGDSYAIRDLDLQGYPMGRDGKPDGSFEICAHFEDCIEKSSTKEKASELGYLGMERVGWTSTKPHEPVNIRYFIEEIESIFDEDENFEVYGREGGSQGGN